MGFIQAEDLKGRVDAVLGIGGPHYSAALRYDFFPFHRGGSRSGGLAVTPTVQAKYWPGEAFNSFSVWAGVEGTWWSGSAQARARAAAGRGVRREEALGGSIPTPDT